MLGFSRQNGNVLLKAHASLSTFHTIVSARRLAQSQKSLPLLKMATQHQAEGSKDSFKHAALDQTRRSIRLLQVARTVFGIEGSLKHFEIGSEPEYVALSYTWGKGDATKVDPVGR